MEMLLFDLAWAAPIFVVGLTLGFAAGALMFGRTPKRDAKGRFTK